VRTLRIAACALLLLCASSGRAASEAVAEPPSPAPAAGQPEPAAAPPAAELRQTIADTGVSLPVPEGFRASEDFPGIGRAEDLTSVMVTLLDVPVAIAAEAFGERPLAQRGFELQSTTRVQVDGRDATRIDATQRIGGMSFRKWFLLLGDETRSVLLTATTPLESEAQYRDALVHVLLSAQWGAPRAPAEPKPLSFQVREAAPLRIVRSGDDAIVLTDPGAAPGRVAPLVSVGASRALVAIPDLAAFARERLEQTVSVREIALDSEQERRLATLGGHEIRASALDTDSGRAVKVHQILASDGSRYYLVQGIFDAEDAQRLEPAFEAVASSFELRASTAAAGAAAAPGAPAGIR
jgi:hypothetical protein